MPRDPWDLKLQLLNGLLIKTNINVLDLSFIFYGNSRWYINLLLVHCIADSLFNGEYAALTRVLEQLFLIQADDEGL